MSLTFTLYMYMYMYKLQYPKEVSYGHGGVGETMNEKCLKDSLGVMKTPTSSCNTITINNKVTSILNFSSKHII